MVLLPRRIGPRNLCSGSPDHDPTRYGSYADVPDAETPPHYTEALKRRGFSLEERIGSGASGSVYRALQLSLSRREVAVKFCDTRALQSDRDRKRFEREANLLALLQHPGIPFVITQGSVPTLPVSTPYFVMQYVAGETLQERLRREPVVESAETTLLLQYLLDALQCAHDSDVVHRDVKPSNIIISRRGRAFLVDFSIGVSARAEGGLTRATSTGQGVGTWLYAAPEQLRDASVVDKRSDIYSLGVVAAEMLGARPPVTPETLRERLQDQWSPLVEAVIRAVCARPEGRFQTAREFRDALTVTDPTASSLAFQESLVLCPKAGCTGGVWSSRGYFRGPKVHFSSERFCEHCGTEYLRGCQKCRRPLPANLAELVCKRTKSDRDSLEAHCVGCGELLFRTPTCSKCGSLLQDKDLGSGAKDGCSKPRCMARLGDEPVF